MKYLLSFVVEEGAMEDATPAERKEAMERWSAFDIDGIVALLREDATLRMPPRPAVVGADAIGHFFAELCGGGGIDRIQVAPTHANGRPGVAMWRHEGERLVPHGILLLEIDGALIGGLDAFIDPTLLPLFGSRSSD